MLALGLFATIRVADAVNVLDRRGHSRRNIHFVLVDLLQLSVDVSRLWLLWSHYVLGVELVLGDQSLLALGKALLIVQVLLILRVLRKI